MPKKKHRLSWLYEDPAAGNADRAPDENALAVSPVEITYPSDIVTKIVVIEEPPAIETENHAEAPPAEEWPIFEECPPTEEGPTVEECPPAEEDPTVEDCPPAEEDPIVGEAEAGSGPEAVPHTQPVSESKADTSDDEASGSAEPPDDPAGEVVLICTSCTTMLLIEYDGPCPYSVTSLMDSYDDSYSWLLHTTCFSCVNKHKHKRASRDSFGNECWAAFRAALISEEFIKWTRWFEFAGRVCRKPIMIVMDESRRSVAYGKIDVIREETTANCRVRGLKSVESRVGKSGRNELLESFVPGGFM